MPCRSSLCLGKTDRNAGMTARHGSTKVRGRREHCRTAEERQRGSREAAKAQQSGIAVQI